MEMQQTKNVAAKKITQQETASGAPVSFAQFDVQGDGFQAKGIRIGNLQELNRGIYSLDGNSSYFSLGSSGDYSIAGVFYGQETGYAKNASMTFTAGGRTYEADQSVSLKIDEYQEVGGIIRGSFSGIFKRYDVDPLTGKRLEFSIWVKNGQFAVNRQQNI